ncbi:hypothetical protein OHA72_42920 [Dactylosporangium sp. NBC_01737]|jgi:hypothetical protein|uniref:hypothetical protein n=1 Tax=Dactylosporangium sp. NBC_01737 TaxID=2975959 RepID=UPI002E15F2CE|nr:hypothetical protein OHA72_42920 [Dactylosporangium sp. NBC_01737]
MTWQFTPKRRTPVCGTVPTTDPTDAVIRLRRVEFRLEVLAAALRTLTEADAGTPAQRQRARDAAAMLDSACL